MSLLDRAKAMTSLVLNVPSDITSLKVIIEQKVASEAAALKREAVALEHAITPEFEAEFQKLEELLSHIPGLSEIVKAHTAVDGAAGKAEGFVERALHAVEDALAPTPPAAPAPGSDAIPTTPVL